MERDWVTPLGDILTVAKKRRVDSVRYRAFCSLCFAEPNESGDVIHVSGCRAKRRAITFVPI